MFDIIIIMTGPGRKYQKQYLLPVVYLVAPNTVNFFHTIIKCHVHEGNTFQTLSRNRDEKKKPFNANKNFQKSDVVSSLLFESSNSCGGMVACYNFLGFMNRSEGLSPCINRDMVTSKLPL